MAELLMIGLETPQERYERPEREEYAPLRKQIANFKKVHKVTNAQAKFVNKFNFARQGSQIMVQIMEINAEKNDKQLKKSKMIYLSKTISEEMRAGLATLADINDFPIIKHTNEGVDKDGNPFEPYLLVVRPTAKFDEETNKLFDQAGVDDKTETGSYTRETPSIKGILQSISGQPN